MANVMFTDELLAKVVELSDSNRTDQQIADDLGLTFRQVKYARKKAGYVKAGAVKISAENISAIKTLAGEGLTSTQIGRSLGVSKPTVQKYLRQFGIARPTGAPRRHSHKKNTDDWPESEREYDASPWDFPWNDS